MHAVPSGPVATPRPPPLLLPCTVRPVGEPVVGSVSMLMQNHPQCFSEPHGSEPSAVLAHTSGGHVEVGDAAVGDAIGDAAVGDAEKIWKTLVPPKA